MKTQIIILLTIPVDKAAQLKVFFGKWIEVDVLTKLKQDYTMTNKNYTLYIRNAQGASEKYTKVASIARAKRILKGEWSDIKNLYAELRDQSDTPVAMKPFKKLSWVAI